MEYKKNDIVKIITNQPGVHLMEMFGHCKFNPDEIETSEYIARVKSVIADGKAYVVAVISDGGGHICILNPDEIIGQLEESDLTQEQRDKYHERCHLDAPNVYDNDPSWLDDSLSIDQKCEAVARKAIYELFPDAKIRSVEPDEGFFLENYIKDLDDCLEQFGAGKSKRKLTKLRKKRDELESWFRKMRFKEYYAVSVGVEQPASADDIERERWAYDALCKHVGNPDKPFVAPKTVTTFWLVAIDLHFEEVSIMRNGEERNHFFLSLGAEHDNLYHAKIDFAYECMR